MPRKTEIQAEEIAVGSPLRRSTRNTSINSAAAVVTRRTSQTQNETAETKASKTRRASLSQENSEKDEKVENKPATRGRRASTTKEEPDQKPEPVKTRSRRSSTASEPAAEEPKAQAVSKRRGSSTIENPSDPETVKPIRTRRSSAAEKLTEEESTTKPIRTRRGSVKDEDPKEEPVKRTTRSRRSSVDKIEEQEAETKEKVPKEEPVKRTTRSRRSSVDKVEEQEAEPKEKKPATRGRRSSTDKLENEPETKSVKLTPVKSRRRLSVTENAVNLEPIEELETEVKGRNSNSPVLVQPNVNLTPVKAAKIAEAKVNLNLSIINESSFAEEVQDGEEEVVIVRRSPRLNKSISSEKSDSPTNSPKHKQSIMEENHSLHPDDKDTVKTEDVKLKSEEKDREASVRKLDFTSTEMGSDDEKDTKVEHEAGSHPIETDKSENEQILKNEKGTDILEEKPSEENDGSKQLTEVENYNISMGQDGSFKFSMNESLASNQTDSAAEKGDDVNTSRSSNGSDKENIDINALVSPSIKKPVVEEKELILSSLTANVDKIPTQQEVIARVSDVFRPTMKECSFMEPMEVDEYPSVLEFEQDELDKSTGDGPAVSTPLANQSIKDVDIKHLNKNLPVEILSVTENDSVDESFNLCLSLNQGEEEKATRDMSQSIKDEVAPDSEEDSEIKTTKAISDGKNSQSVQHAEDLNEKLKVDQEESVRDVAPEVEQITSVVANVELKQEEVSEGAERTYEVQTEAAIELDMGQATNEKNISLGMIKSPQSETTESTTIDLKKKCPSPSPDLFEKSHGIASKVTSSSSKSNSPQHIEAQEVKSPQAEQRSDENLEIHDKEKRRSKSPTFILLQAENHSQNEETVKKSKSPQPQLPKDEAKLRKERKVRKSKSPQRRKSKSPQPQHSPEDKKPSKKESTLSGSKSPSPKLDSEKSDIEKSTQSVSPSLLQKRKDSARKSSSPVQLKVEKRVDENSVSSKIIVGKSQEKGTTSRKSKSPLANTEIQVGEIPTSPKRSAEQYQEEGIPLKKSKSTELKTVFDSTFSPSSLNIKISDIEMEVRRRSRSPEPWRKANSPQANAGTSGLKPTENVMEKTEHQENVEDSKQKRTSLSQDMSEELENVSTGLEQLKKNLEQQIKQSTALGPHFEPKVPENSPNDSIGNIVNPPHCKESLKSDQSDDYDFEIPSDEEEAERTHAPEYDQSTVLTSFLATSHYVTDVSITTVIETLSGPSNEMSSPDEVTEDKMPKNSLTPEKDGPLRKSTDKFLGVPTLEANINEENIKINDSLKNLSLEEKDIDENDDVFERAELQKELNNIDDEEIDDGFQDEVQDYETDGRGDESSGILKNSSKNEALTLSPKKLFHSKASIENAESDDDFLDPRDVKIVRSYIGSPQNRIKMKKKIDFNKKELGTEKTLSKTMKKIKKNTIKDLSSAEEYIEEDNVASDDDVDIEDIKSKRFKKKNVTPSEDDFISKVIESESPKKKSKINNLGRKRNSDENIQDVIKPKRLRKSTDLIMKETQDIEETKVNSKRSAKKKKKKAVATTVDATYGDISDKQKNKISEAVDDDASDSKENITEKPKKKNRAKFYDTDDAAQSIDPILTSKTKTEYPKEVACTDSPKKMSPFSKLDEFLARKMAEMESNEESYGEEEDENSEEPNDFVYTMAEEGEEDTPSEDSNAIIDEGESINSTDTEYGSDDRDEESDNDSFICDDEEVELLSGEEYDLDNVEIKKKKKSRIIPLDDCDDDIIKIWKKEKRTSAPRKRSRIITVSDSSESDAAETGLFEDTDSKGGVKSPAESSEEVICVEERTDEDISMVETKPCKTPEASSSHPDVNATQSQDTQQRTEKRRLSSITIHENIDIKEIKDAQLSERISNLLGSFCTTMPSNSEVSMNLSIECSAKDDEVFTRKTKKRRNRKKKRVPSSSFTSMVSESSHDADCEEPDLEEETSAELPRKLSVSLDNIDLNVSKKRTRKKRRLSKSLDDMAQVEVKKKKRRAHRKRNVERKKFNSPESVSPSDDLQSQSLGLINQLVTDVKNRPRRTVMPSTNMNDFWITEVADVRPSTTAFDRKEKAAYKAGKVHPKDFRSQMLNDPSRVRRVDTKTLLRKKGVYL